MRATPIIWILLALLFGCSEDNGLKAINEEPLGPPESNQVPLIAFQSDTNAIVGDTLKLQVSATDPDGDALQYEEEMWCTWSEVINNNCHLPVADIDSQTGSFWFYPRTYDIPTRHVFVTVSDGRGGHAYMEFDVSVSTGQ